MKVNHTLIVAIWLLFEFPALCKDLGKIKLSDNFKKVSIGKQLEYFEDPHRNTTATPCSF